MALDECANEIQCTLLHLRAIRFKSAACLTVTLPVPPPPFLPAIFPQTMMAMVVDGATLIAPAQAPA
jgi:hypothetical protein